MKTKEIQVKDFINGPVVYDNDGQYFWIQDQVRKGNQMLAELRGWGAINSMFVPDLKEAAKFQDKIGQWIADAINEKLNRETDQYSTAQEGRYVSNVEIERMALECYPLMGNDVAEKVHSELREAAIFWMKQLRDQIFTSPPEMEREWINRADTFLSKFNLSEHDRQVIIDWFISPPRSVGDKKDEV